MTRILSIAVALAVGAFFSAGTLSAQETTIHPAVVSKHHRHHKHHKHTKHHSQSKAETAHL